MRGGIETLWSAEEVERFIRLPAPLKPYVLLEQCLLKLYKSVLVTLVALIAQAISHSQAQPSENSMPISGVGEEFLMAPLP